MRSLFNTYGLTHRSCAFIPPHKTRHGFSSGSRESHMDLDGKTSPAGEAFHTIWGNELRYPGDPSAPAREVINCHCTLIPHVLLKGESLPEGSESGIIPTWQEQYDKRSILPESKLTNGLPIKSKPFSIADKVDDDGNVLQRRFYGANGKAKYDLDMSDHGSSHAHPTGAHKHIFNYNKKNPHGSPRKFSKEDLERNADIIKPGVNYFDE